MITKISTCNGEFNRRAWTGGSVPFLEFKDSDVGIQLFNFFMEEQIQDCGGMDNIQKCGFGKLSLLRNRAWLDAWATYRDGVQPKTKGKTHE